MEEITTLMPMLAQTDTYKHASRDPHTQTHTVSLRFKLMKRVAHNSCLQACTYIMLTKLLHQTEHCLHKISFLNTVVLLIITPLIVLNSEMTICTQNYMLLYSVIHFCLWSYVNTCALLSRQCSKSSITLLWDISNISLKAQYWVQ